RSELMTGKPDGDKRLFDGRSGAERLYYHAIVPLDLAKPSPTKELPLTLRRGITVTGRVLGPDGKGIPRGFLFCSGELLPAQKNVLELPYALGEHLSGAVRIENGRFELRGCDPDKNYRLFFFEDIGEPGKEPGHAVSNTPFALTEARRGAILEIRPKEMAGKPLTVKLEAPGAAEVRFLDIKGRPLKRVGGYQGADAWHFDFVDVDGKAI